MSAARREIAWRGIFRYLAARLNPFTSTAVARTRAGHLFRCFPRDVVGRRLLRDGVFEPVLTDALVERLSRSGVGAFVDVGANIGWHSIRLGGLPSISRVLSIEPEPSNFRLLETNIRLNGLTDRITAICAAAGVDRGHANLNLYRGSNRGRHSLVQDHDGRGSGAIQVEVRRLDDLVADAGLRQMPIHAMKIDVEGAEPEVIAGGLETLRRCDLLAIELNPPSKPHRRDAYRQLIQTLESSGLQPVWSDPTAGNLDFRSLLELDRGTDVLLCRGDD
jgi:FkbM family methyltransferase